MWISILCLLRLIPHRFCFAGDVHACSNVKSYFDDELALSVGPYIQLISLYVDDEFAGSRVEWNCHTRQKAIQVRDVHDPPVQTHLQTDFACRPARADPYVVIGSQSTGKFSTRQGTEPHIMRVQGC
jgi:hypothetical protein